MNYIRELEAEKLHSDTMKAAAALWMRRAQEAERTVAVLVLAAGGEIIVRSSHLVIAPEIELIREDQAHDMSTRFSARLTPSPQPR